MTRPPHQPFRQRQGRLGMALILVLGTALLAWLGPQVLLLILILNLGVLLAWLLQDLKRRG